MTAIVAAGTVEPDPATRVIGYVAAHPTTVLAYDLAGPEAASVLTREEIGRTQIIRSRISAAEADWFVELASNCDPLWQALPGDARLADADPSIHGGLSDQALALFEHFSKPPRPRASLGKISKVLHLKRPHLFPILDTELRGAYQSQAEERPDGWNSTGQGCAPPTKWRSETTCSTQPTWLGWPSSAANCGNTRTKRCDAWQISAMCACWTY